MKKSFFLLYLIIPYFCSSQEVNSVLSNIDQRLKEKLITVTQVLTADSLMSMHSLPAFREVVKNNAVTGKISIISQNEPGKKITIKGQVTEKNGIPGKNILVYFYQTSAKGWYSDTAAHILTYEGDYRHARLFGYLKTDNQGKFTIETIKPNGYPNSELPAHVHIQMWRNNGDYLKCPGELQFEDDPRMTLERRKKSLAEGFLIARNSNTEEYPFYEYSIKVY